MSYNLHVGVCGRKTQKRTLSPTYTYAQLVRLSAKQQRASQIHPPKLTNISVKALLEAAAPLPHPAEFRKLCIGNERLRYFSLWKRVANPILFWMFKIVFRPDFISLDKKYAFFALLIYQCERLAFTNLCHSGRSNFLWSYGVSAKVLSRYILFINSRIRSVCNTLSYRNRSQPTVSNTQFPGFGQAQNTGGI